MRILETSMVVALATQCKNNSQQDSTSSESPSISVSYDIGDGLGDGACEQSYIDDDLSVFDAYPGDNTDYPMMDVIDYPTGFAGDDFESYAHNLLIASASSSHSFIDVTWPFVCKTPSRKSTLETWIYNNTQFFVCWRWEHTMECPFDIVMENLH